MNNKVKSDDLFAVIAAQRPKEQAGLIIPPPPPRPEHGLPVQSEVAPLARFQPRPIMTPVDMAGELGKLRERFAPFLQNLVPILSPTRLGLKLESFQWRVETMADQADFTHVLSGGGVWERVQIPHFGGPLGRAVTYYRTPFEVTAEMQAKGRLFVCFKGVDYKAHVFINGHYMGSHEGFFAPFEFDFTAQARLGNNTIVIKVENDAICGGNTSWGENGMEFFEGDKIYAATGPGYDDPEVGWHHCPPGMGIYQEVRIEARAGLFIHDLFVRPLPAENRAEAWVELWNCDIHPKSAKLTLSVFGQNFEATLCEDREFSLPGTLGPRVNYYRLNLEIPEPRLWDLDTPWLYQLQAKLYNPAGQLLDAAACQFGMRSFRMDIENEPRGRMTLNGREIRLRGANTMGFEQQDVMKQDWAQLIDDILLAKLCNMNFWRLTQRPVQSEVYDYCDRLGLMTQSDLPLFGMLRRSQFAEGMRQAGEMERLIRSHPCNIMVSYINEPFPTIWGLKLWRHLARHELESFFLACDQAVHLENPDRVIKAVDGDYDPPGPGLPDNHCYCGWYNGHGLDLGKLHRGYWQRIKPGWMFGCGEFGTEGLDFVDLMRRRYPSTWLPQTPEEERVWSPSQIVKTQTDRFHFTWFDTQHSLEDWVNASQTHQAWSVRIMTEAMRRDSRLNTCAIHLFIDAFPAGWVKAIMDVERRPKPAFFTYREALTPLMVNLRSDRFACFSGETVEMEAWVCNDTSSQPQGARLAYRLELGGQSMAGGWSAAQVPVCSSACQGLLRFNIPAVTTRGIATVRLALLAADDSVMHDTSLELNVFPPPVEDLSSVRVAILGVPDGKAATLACDLGIVAGTWTPGQEAVDTILADDLAVVIEAAGELRAVVQKGTKVVILEIAAGEQSLFEDKIVCKECGMNPVQFVSRATGHSLVAGFEPDDFKFWYDAVLGYPSPLLERTFTVDGWSPILVTGQGGWGSDWFPALAAAEKRDGKGFWRICNVKLAGRIQGNPVASVFARRLLAPDVENRPKPEVFLLHPGHPATQLDGCVVTPDKSGLLSFVSQEPCRSVVVLKAGAPLMIVEQQGLTAKLRLGWDGTLGYSLYALEVEIMAPGEGWVRLAVVPVPVGKSQSNTVFAARGSRFPDTPAAFQKWQQKWQAKLASLLMKGGFPARVPLAVEVLETEVRPLYTLRRVRYQTQSDRSNTLLLALPKKGPGPVPLLITLHGHEATWGEADARAFTLGHDDDFCAYFAARGWAVVQPATMNHTLQHTGWTLQGEWTWDAMVALDYATGLSGVDARRVAVCGLSSGAHLAMNLLALDGRVRAGVVGCILSTWHHYRERMRIPPHCDCGIYSQLGGRLEQCDWAALAAPKPVQFQHGRRDACYCPGADPALLDVVWNTAVMPEDEFAAVFAEVERAYQLAGVAGNVKRYLHGEGHRVDNLAAWEFLERHNG